jgi:hypothetical protein
MTARFTLEMPEELLARVNEARGLVARNAWIRQAIERALTGPSAESLQTGPHCLIRAVKQPQTYSFLPDGEPIEDDPPDKFEAYCQCGWRGPQRDSPSAAVTDGHRHAAAPSEQPDPEIHWRPDSAEEKLLDLNVENVRSSSQAKRDVKPIPKKGGNEKR